MKSNYHTSRWLLIAIVSCLFVLSLTAPRAWRVIVRRRAFADQAAARAGISPSVTEPVPAVPEWLTTNESEPFPAEDNPLSYTIAKPVPSNSSSPWARSAERDLDPTPPLAPDPVFYEPEPTPLDLEDSIPATVAPVDEPSPVAVDPPQGFTAWPRPEELIGQLQALRDVAVGGDWPRHVLMQLDHLASVESLAAAQTAGILHQLNRLAEEGRREAEKVAHALNRTDLLRARYALTRRLAVWNPVHQINVRQLNSPNHDSTDPASVVGAIQAVEDFVRGGAHADSWKTYLLLEELRGAAQINTDEGAGQRRRLAQRVLARMQSPRLSRVQSKLIAREPFSRLAAQLKRWAREPIDLRGVLAALEQYEQQGAMEQAGRLADAARLLQWSTLEDESELGHQLDTHYRNANIRVMLAGRLINRLLPVPQQVDEEVDEEIQSAPVVGYSTTETRLRARLLPDPYRWRLGLEAEGRVDSDTSSYHGPVTLFNEATSYYKVRKLLVIDRWGIRVKRAQADAETYTELTDLETTFDTVPLINLFVQTYARSQYEAKQYEATLEAEEKLADKARQRFDMAIHSQLTKLERQFQQRVTGPLMKLELQTTAMNMQTNRQRLIARYRIAGMWQLGAHTARPRQPAGCQLSVQVHQSAINNVIEQLKLDGRKSDLRELYGYLNDALGRSGASVPEDIPRRVTLRFAEEQAVHVRFVDGRAVMTLKLAELRNGRRRRWRNFTIRAFYRIEPVGRQVRLVRDGTIQLGGRRFRLGDQIALRGVFSKVFSRNRPLNLFHEKIIQDPRLDYLAVTQQTIDHGWLAAALGPQHQAKRPPGAVKK